MSSKRGRKRNDNLPPNRARDVQRAFRARRAAHLQALEQRVQELEEENICLRQALNLPPANRVPLGKGPTGKDKPKSFGGSHSTSLELRTSRDSSSADSPDSTRDDSLSPSMMAASMPPRTVQDMDDNWDQSIMVHDQQSEVPNSSTSSNYNLPPMSTVPISSKSMYPQSPYSSSIPQPPSRPLSNPVYMNSPTGYPHSAERPSMSYNQGYGSMRSQPRDERSYSSYGGSFSNHENDIHTQDSPPMSSIHSGRDSAGSSYQRQDHYMNQRIQLPPMQEIRPPSVSLLDVGNSQLSPRPAAYASDGRLMA